MRLLFVLFSAVLGGLTAAFTPNPVHANCYEIFGCTDSSFTTYRR
jgi:hypothetical protein